MNSSRIQTVISTIDDDDDDNDNNNNNTGYEKHITKTKVTLILHG
jgi:hypothetical protein